MPLPEFTREERFVLDSLKYSDMTSNYNVFMWSYLTGGTLLAAFAAYYGSIPMMASAFATLTILRIYEERWNSKWSHIWKSVIAKYDTALADSEKRNHSSV
jgi:hypothetical protein